MLSPSQRQVAHALLTRPPLIFATSKLVAKSVRLECVMHAASVYPEPGSNSLKKYPLCTWYRFSLSLKLYLSLFLLSLLGICKSLNLLYSWNLRVLFASLVNISISNSLCFLVFRCSIFKVRSLPSLEDSSFSISHLLSLVKYFFIFL